MSGRRFFFSLWCLTVLGLFAVSGYFGWSPFADGGRAARGSGIYGPTHK